MLWIGEPLFFLEKLFLFVLLVVGPCSLLGCLWISPVLFVPFYSAVIKMIGIMLTGTSNHFISVIKVETMFACCSLYRVGVGH